MAVSSENRQNDVHARAFSALCSRAASHGDQTWVSFRHCLKATGVVEGVSQYLRDLGFTGTEVKTIYPVILHVESLVYQGDLACEKSQKQKSSSSRTTWRSGIEEILDSYGLDHHELREEIEELDRYFHDESLIMLGDPQVTEDLVRETCYRRSADMRILFRVAYLLTRRPGCEGCIRFSCSFMLLAEIWNDLVSYEKDTTEDELNTLRVFGWIHGTDQARKKLDEWIQSLFHDCVNQIARVDRSFLIAQYIAQCILVAHLRGQPRSAIHQVGVKSRRHFIRLFHLLPRILFIHLTTRQLELIKADLCAQIPPMIEEPSRFV